MAVIQIAANNVVAKLINPDHNARMLVRDMLSYEIDGAKPTATWDGRGSFFNYRECTFPAGFVAPVRAKLSKSGYVVQMVQRPLPGALGPDMDRVEARFGTPDPRYGYQRATVEELERRGRMIAQVATGGGKSRCAMMAYLRIGRPTLFITTRGVLMYQMKRTFERTLGIGVGVVGDGEFKPSKGFTVAMVQTLASALEEKTLESEVRKLGRGYKEFTQREVDALRAKVAEHNKRRDKVLRMLEYYELVIAEEAHESGGNQYYEVLSKCRNAAYRLGLTATPFMRDSEESNMRLMGAMGQVGIRVTEKELIDKGILATPKFLYADVQKPMKLLRGTGWPKCQKVGIVENEHRNLRIVEEVGRAARHGLPSMVLIQRKDHGAILEKMMKAAGIRARFIYGKHEQDERDKALADLAAGRIDCLIGSCIVDVGVDVPAVGLVVLAGGGKAEVALRQRIGRGLRAKKDGPNVAFVLDFRDQHNKYLLSHAIERREVVDGTEGFRENVLPPGAGFDYSIFTTTKAA